MVRVKHSVPLKKGRKRVLRKTKGQFGQRGRRYRQAVRSLSKGMVYAYRDRKVKKREFKRLWIIRISAACKEEGLSYSRFIKGLTDAKVGINRKVLADLAVHSPAAFKRLVKVAKESNHTPASKSTQSTK